MTRYRTMAFGLALAALAAGPALSGATKPAAAPQSAESKKPTAAEAAQIAKLCKQLGESQYGSKGACEKLIAIGEPAMPALLKALKDKRPQARWWAVAAVCTIGTDEGYPAVLKVIRSDTNGMVRSTAVYYLRHFRKKGKDIWPAVEEALGSKSPEVARWALRLMVEDGYPKMDDALRKVLAGTNSELRSYALQHVRDMYEQNPKKAKTFLPLVQKVVKAKDPRIRCDAIHTAVILMEKGQLPFLRKIYDSDKSPGVQETALRCITVMTNPPVEAIELLLMGLENEDEKVRDAAAKLLAKGCKQYFGFDAKQPLGIRQGIVEKWGKWYLQNRAKLQWHPDLRKFLLPGARKSRPAADPTPRSGPGKPAKPAKPKARATTKAKAQ